VDTSSTTTSIADDDAARLMRPSDVVLLALAAFAAGDAHERARCRGLVVEEREAWRGEPSNLTVGELCGTLCADIDAAE
jgi:hypothetical protein